MTRPTKAVVDLDVIRENCHHLRSHMAQAVVIKANAYGHGALSVARALDVEMFAVALVEEGIELRNGGIETPILILGESPPSSAHEVIEYRLTPSVSGAPMVKALSTFGRCKVHVAVDTGMRREGTTTDEALDLCKLIDDDPNLKLDGVWSHLAMADEQGHDFTAAQIGRFSGLVTSLDEVGIQPRYTHLLNSGGVLSGLKVGNMTRVGLSAYGLYPAQWMRPLIELRPALKLVSAVSSVRRASTDEGASYGLTWRAEKPTTLATVPIGYGDGYPRALSNRAEVLIGGKRRPVAGRVTMDSIIIDCGTDDPHPGDEVVLIGSQNAQQISADELADHAGTINYEIVTGLSSRVPRVYE